MEQEITKKLSNECPECLKALPDLDKDGFYVGPHHEPEFPCEGDPAEPEAIFWQAANAKCLNNCVQGHFRVVATDGSARPYPDVDCDACHGTGLRWSKLSQPCLGGDHRNIHDERHYHSYCRVLSRTREEQERSGVEYLAECFGGCRGSGRSPNVSADTLLETLSQESGWSFVREGESWILASAVFPHRIFRGETFELAACAALLRSD